MTKAQLVWTGMEGDISKVISLAMAALLIPVDANAPDCPLSVSFDIDELDGRSGSRKPRRCTMNLQGFNICIFIQNQQGLGDAR